jgi:hypothetical protein
VRKCELQWPEAGENFWKCSPRGLEKNQQPMGKMAKPLYRVAAVLFLLFAAGHTAGFLTFRPDSADALAVLEGMKRVHFDVNGTSVTWIGFYTGFGLFVSVYLLFSAFLAWRLGSSQKDEANLARTLGWMLFIVQLVNIALCIRYFGVVQAAFAAACAASVGAAALASVARRS